MDVSTHDEDVARKRGVFLVPLIAYEGVNIRVVAICKYTGRTIRIGPKGWVEKQLKTIEVDYEYV